LTLQSPKLGGLKVGDHDDLPADKLLGRVMIADTRTDLSLFTAEVDLEHDEFVGVGMGLSGPYGAHPKFELAKFLNGDHARPSLPTIDYSIFGVPERYQKRVLEKRIEQLDNESVLQY
jgi:hypothetical protein